MIDQLKIKTCLYTVINTYRQLLKQKYAFPSGSFDVENDHLVFHGLSLQRLIEKYGTPLRIYYLPDVKAKIEYAKGLFQKAIDKYQYKGQYHFCYCTKCCHLEPIVTTALNAGAHLETSSPLDIDLIDMLYKQGKLDQNNYLIHNGYKGADYLKKVIELNRSGFENAITVLDSVHEYDLLQNLLPADSACLKIGFRLAIDEPKDSIYPASRFGIKAEDILALCEKSIVKNKKVELRMLHFFVDSGINDTLYFWSELEKLLQLYARLKRTFPTLDALNLGGGFPVQNTLDFDFDYERVIDKTIHKIRKFCTTHRIEMPDLFTEFGKYTIGESGAIIYSVVEQKIVDDELRWYLIDNSLMNTLPDAYTGFDQFILLPVNKWDQEYTRATIGGMSCDQTDYYSQKNGTSSIPLPAITHSDKEPLYIGIFHTGAYQDALSGYGGLKHCLIPAPKQVFISKDENGNLIEHTLNNPGSTELLKILGF